MSGTCYFKETHKNMALFSRHHIQTSCHDWAIVESRVEPPLKQTKRLPRSVCATAQSYQGLRCPLTESLSNVERIDVHVYTKVLSDSLADLGFTVSVCPESTFSYRVS